MGTIEYRKLFRAKTNIKVFFETTTPPIQQGELMSGDISSIGLHAIGCHPFQVGDELLLKIFLRKNKESISARSRVVWQKPCSFVPDTNRRYYATGLMFLEMSMGDAILASDFIFDIAKKSEEEQEKKIINQLESKEL